METLSFQDLVTKWELPSTSQITWIHGGDQILPRDNGRIVAWCAESNWQPIVITRHGRNFQIRCAALVGELTSLWEGVFCGHDPKNWVPCPLISRFRATPLEPTL